VNKQMRKKEKIDITKQHRRIVTVELKLSFSSRKIHQVAFCDEPTMRCQVDKKNTCVKIKSFIFMGYRTIVLLILNNILLLLLTFLA